MRRAQSVRHYSRPSLASGADDLGVLTESEPESTEDALRRQLLEMDRENDKLKTQIQTLQAQLAQRPPLETIQEFEKEYKNLELLLQGTNRENERAMMELERGKAREKMLERELAKLAGENWQSSLDIPSSSTFARTAATAATATNTTSAPSAIPQATLAHVEQVRLLVLGMEQRLQVREEKLKQQLERAEREGRRYQELGKAAVSA